MAYFRTYNGERKLVLTAKDKTVGNGRRRSRLGDIKKLSSRRMTTDQAQETITHLLRCGYDPTAKLQEWIEEQEEHLECLYLRAQATLKQERSGKYVDGASPTGQVKYPRHSIDQVQAHIRYLKYVLKGWDVGYI